jgi:uncharacterized protein YdeI (YjbR/CyaY-like superfamily)
MEQYDVRVDAYTAKAADFAKPIIGHIRQLVHDTSPLLVENIKWGHVFFEYDGPVLQLAAFKEHCAVGFWKATLLNDPHKVLKIGDGSAGSFGKLTSVADLPPDDILKDFILQAIALNENGVKVPVVKKAPTAKTELLIPDDLIAAFKDNPKAAETFYNFSNSHRKEYVQWITEAKTEATRTKRIAQAIEMMEVGKSRNWKYQR